MAEMYVIVSANIEDELMKRGIFSWVDYYAKNDRLFVQTEQSTTIVSNVTSLLHEGCSAKRLASAIVRSMKKHSKAA